MKPSKKIRNIKCRRDIMQYNEYILNCILLYSVFNGCIPTKIMIPQICAPAAALYYAFCPRKFRPNSTATVVCYNYSADRVMPLQETKLYK